jgi:hypothetical protein
MPGVRLQRYVRDDGIGTPNGRAGWNPDALRRDIRRPSTVSTGAVRADLARGEGRGRSQGGCIPWGGRKCSTQPGGHTNRKSPKYRAIRKDARDHGVGELGAPLATAAARPFENLKRAVGGEPIGPLNFPGRATAP